MFRPTPPERDVDFTFAIVNWNTRDLLDACLASIMKARGEFSIQVLVADNGSNDGSANMVRRKYPGVTVVENGANLGFAAGHAPLFGLSEGRYHVLVNSDVRLEADCLPILHRRMEQDPDIGVLGCRIHYPDGAIQPSCRRFPSLGLQLIEASGLNRLFPNSPRINAYKMGGFDHRQSREVDQVMGSFFLIRDRVLDDIGQLDTAFFMYYEEVDYCLRSRQAGYKVFFESDAAVCHVGGGSSEGVKVLTIRRTMRSMRLYFRKHKGRWTWAPLLLILSLDLVTHFAHALLTRKQPSHTLKAYALGLWDVATFKPAN